MIDCNVEELPPLKFMAQLTQLSMPWNEIDHEVFDTVASAMPRLNILDISNSSSLW